MFVNNREINLYCNYSTFPQSISAKVILSKFMHVIVIIYIQVVAHNNTKFHVINAIINLLITMSKMSI